MELLELVADHLSKAGFVTQMSEVADLRGNAVFAETTDELVCVFVNPDGGFLRGSFDAVEAKLADLGVNDGSPRRWDYYSVALLADPESVVKHSQIIREIEYDTNFSRKIVRVVDPKSRETVDAALRPLMPLREPKAVRLEEPLTALRREMLDSNVDSVLIDKAFDSYEATGEVRI